MPNHIDPSVIELSPAAMLRRRAEAIAGAVCKSRDMA